MPPAAAAEPPRLTGIVVVGPERLAIFAGAETPVLREGDRLGEERVVAIQGRTVHLDGPRGTRRLSPTGDGAGTGDSAGAPVGALPSVVDPYWRERETENDQ